MSGADWGLAITLGGASSLHCAGMCGPLVIAYGSSVPRHAVLPHLAYNGGRILTYSLLGALAGFAGHGAGWLGHITGLEHWIALLGGVLLVMAGLFLTGFAGNGQLIQIGGRGPANRLVRIVGPLLLAPGAGGKFGLGLGLGLLPCGLVYAALAKAATMGNAIDGASTMAAFGTGTAASLLAIGLFSGGWRNRLARHGTRLAAACVILLGLVSVWRGASVAWQGTREGASCHVNHGS